MNEDPRSGWEVVVDDVLEDWDIDTTSCDIRNDEDAGSTASESIHLLLTSGLVEGSVDVRDGVTGGDKEGREVVDVVLGGGEDEGLMRSHLRELLLLEELGRSSLLVIPLPSLPSICSRLVVIVSLLVLVLRDGLLWISHRDSDDLSKDGEESGLLLCWLDREERHLEVVTDLALGVETDETRVLETGLGEFDEVLGEGSGVEESLTRRRESVEDFLKLDLESHFEESVKKGE